MKKVPHAPFIFFKNYGKNNEIACNNTFSPFIIEMYKCTYKENK